MTSFRKRNVQKPIPGTRTSPHTGQVITSSGNPSLDMILGGGMPIGSICLIEEDKYLTNAKVLTKYFLAEGIISKQAIFLASLDDDLSELLRKLPKPLTDEEVAEEQQAADEQQLPNNDLRIAWRYSDLPLVNLEQTNAKIGHHFNLLDQIDPVMLYCAKKTLWDDAAPIRDIVPDDEDVVQDLFGNGQQDTSTSTNTSTTSSNNSTTMEKDAKEAVIDGIDDGNGNSIAAIKTLPMDNNQQQQQQEQEQEQMQMQDSEHTDMDVNVEQAVTPTLPESTNNVNNGNNNAFNNSSITTTPTQSQKNLKQTAQIFENQRYLRLLQTLQTELQDEIYMAQGQNVRKSLCRVCITSLGSPLWYDEQFAQDILKFLTVLRAAVRNVTAVCFITMPMHLIAKYDATLVPKIRNLVDYAIELDAFAGSTREAHPVLKEYNGLLHLRKMTAINTLTVYMPETTDLAFKLRRKKFVIEKLHLPPEFADADADAKDLKNAENIVPTLSCSSNLNATVKANLDF